MCSLSYALGLWRGCHRRLRDVPLAAHIDLSAYRAGFAAGRAQLRG